MPVSTPTQEQADKHGNVTDPPPGEESVPSAFRFIARFTVPMLCLLLTVLAAVYGERVLVEAADMPVVGPLVASQAVGILAGGLFFLFLVTFGVALFPGQDKDQPAPINEDVEEIADTMKSQGASNDEIVAALKRAASAQSDERAIWEERAHRAEEQKAELEARLAAWEDESAPEAQALISKYREEAQRESLRHITELGESHNKVAEGLRAGQQRAEEALAEQSREMDDLHNRHAEETAALRDEHAQAITALTNDLAELNSSIPGVRSEAALDEYERVQIAISAINDRASRDLTPEQAEAVAEHSARITAALKRLRPAQATTTSASTVPGMPGTPKMPATAALTVKDAVTPEPEQASEPAHEKRGRFSRRKK